MDDWSNEQEDAALDAAREKVEAHEVQKRLEFEADIEREAAINPALEAAGLTAFVAWLTAQAWTPKSQHAYDFAVEFALEQKRK